MTVILGAVAAFAALTALAFAIQLYMSRRLRRHLAIEMRARTARLEVSPANGALSHIPPQELSDALSSRTCVLFAGGGISELAGAPTWHSVLMQMLSAAEVAAPDRNWDSLRTQLERQTGDAELVADLLAARLPREMLVSIACQASTRGGKSRDAALNGLGRLPFSAAVTSSWDSVLEGIFSSRKPRILTAPIDDDPSDVLGSSRLFILNTHGSARDPESIVLTWDEFRQSVGNDRTYARFLGTLAASRSLLFVGVTDDVIERFFTGADIDSEPSLRRRHFAFLPASDDLELRAERLSDRYGVRSIPYSSTQELREHIQRLEDKTAHLTQLPQPLRASTAQTPILRRLRLENIGPFTELEIELHPRCTIFVGANGTGKTTLMRALSIAVAGEGPEVAINSRDLLRGDERGVIELETDAATYRTTLTRDGSRIRVTPEQFALAEMSGALALGFPALRGASAGPILGPSPIERDGPADDVLPLIENGVDNRLGFVEQWIVNRDAQRDSGEGRRAIHRFFDHVGQMTPEFPVRFHAVNRRWQIMVDTPYGRIEFRQLPRGVVSLFAWAGVVAARMADIYVAEPNPAEQRGLLLLDEIDIHLHPEWQRTVVPMTRTVFPALQIIASTHSPLVVGSTEDARLVRLERSDNRILVETVDADFTGWRADQILTSGVFGLETSRDRRTELKFDRYARLLRQPGEKTPEQLAELRRLRSELLEVMPEPVESPGTRAALRVLDEALNAGLIGLSPERIAELKQGTDVFLVDPPDEREPT